MARTPRTPADRAASSAVRAPRTAVGTLDAERHASVDPRGRVQLDGEGWALDWWIGAEDRWHLPAEEPSVRQSLIGSSPVVETRIRVPSGDAVQRVYAARDVGGTPVVVVEVENASKIPFAVALAVRAPGLDGVGRIAEISAEGTEVRVDGKLVLVAARAPGRRVAATLADGGVADVVTGGGAQPAAEVSARCPAGQAEAAVVFPLAHTATLRVVLPLEGGAFDVTALPDAAQVASGWRVHAGRGARLVLPDARLQAAVDTNLCHLLLRPHGVNVAAALLRYGFVEESAAELLGDPIAASTTATPGDLLLAITVHWTLTRDQAFAEAATPLIASLVASLGRSGTPAQLRLGALCAGVAAAILESTGEVVGAQDVRRAGTAMAAAAGPPPPPAPSGVKPLHEMLRTASPTSTWVGPDDGHALEVGAAVLVGVRGLLVAEPDAPIPGLQLSPNVPEAWLGQGWEVHDLPTARGPLSFAVRWHGDRPALLWDLRLWSGLPTIQLTAPGLDPTWSTTEPKGEALLGPVALPEPPPSRGVSTPVGLGPTPPKRPR